VKPDDVLSCRRIETSKPLFGRYDGNYSGYIVTFVDGNGHAFELKMKDGIRGTRRCRVAVSSLGIEVE